MGAPGSKLARVLAICAEMAQKGGMAALGDLMAEEVFWQGPLPELSCHGRDEVLGLVSKWGRLPRVTHLDLQELGDRVAITLEGPDFGPGPAGPALQPPGGPRTLVLWFEGDKVVRMESFASRESALAALS